MFEITGKVSNYLPKRVILFRLLLHLHTKASQQQRSFFTFLVLMNVKIFCNAATMFNIMKYPVHIASYYLRQQAIKQYLMALYNNRSHVTKNILYSTLLESIYTGFRKESSPSK